MKQVVVTVDAEVGLHARPASLFVKKAMEFSSSITVKIGEREVDAKRLLAIMSLGVKKGESITIRAEGADEQEAVAALQQLVESNFK